MTHLRWLNQKNQISYEVYTRASHTDAEALEQGLESVMRATALKLSDTEGRSPAMTR
ncbi:hypothetical protein ACIQUF_02355 [Pseudomonas sp. NPDC090233]|uniref:hypothetical protein n=1 Tax=Pseudomonas sp. NPDC090233 TaxID=3364479 RepID=UPI00383A6D2B